jgi:transposase
MQENVAYEDLTKEELIQIIRDQNEQIAALKKEVEELRDPVVKTSANSSIPTSKEQVPRTRSQRGKSDKKPGGQPGHVGHHRERNQHPDKIVRVEASHCESYGASLELIEGTIGQIAEAS